MTLLPFHQPGTFWRGNLHAHSTVSDGTHSPEEVCRMYRQAGYHFLSLTEHLMEAYGYPVIDTRALRTDDFTTLIGAEMHGPQTEMGSPWHLVANGLPLQFDNDPADTGPELAAKAMQSGAFVSVAHPSWYTLTEQDMATLGAFDAVEIFNGVAADHNDRPDSWHMADTLLGRGIRCNVTAADDYHGFAGTWDFQRGWVWVRSEELSPEGILASLKSGAFYSTTGPEIHDVSLNNKRSISISCSPAERVFVSGRGPAVTSVGGRGLTEVELDLTVLDSPYGRVTVRDADGGRAWTNPFWFDEL